MPYSTTNPRIDRDNAAVGSTGNSVFQIKLGGLENDLEQNNDTNPKPDVKKIKIGDFVSGDEVSTNKRVKGKIFKIDVKNKVIYIITKDKEKKKINVSSASEIGESTLIKFKTFSNFIKF